MDAFAFITTAWAARQTTTQQQPSEVAEPMEKEDQEAPNPSPPVDTSNDLMKDVPWVEAVEHSRPPPPLCQDDDLAQWFAANKLATDLLGTFHRAGIHSEFGLACADHVKVDTLCSNLKAVPRKKFYTALVNLKAKLSDTKVTDFEEPCSKAYYAPTMPVLPGLSSILHSDSDEEDGEPAADTDYDQVLTLQELHQQLNQEQSALVNINQLLATQTMAMSKKAKRLLDASKDAHQQRAKKLLSLIQQRQAAGVGLPYTATACSLPSTDGAEQKVDVRQVVFASEAEVWSYSEAPTPSNMAEGKAMTSWIDWKEDYSRREAKLEELREMRNHERLRLEEHDRKMMAEQQASRAAGGWQCCVCSKVNSIMARVQCLHCRSIRMYPQSIAPPYVNWLNSVSYEDSDSSIASNTSSSSSASSINSPSWHWRNLQQQYARACEEITRTWLEQNSDRFTWHHPAFARLGSSRPQKAPEAKRFRHSHY